MPSPDATQMTSATESALMKPVDTVKEANAVDSTCCLINSMVFQLRGLHCNTYSYFGLQLYCRTVSTRKQSTQRAIIWKICVIMVG